MILGHNDDEKQYIDNKILVFYRNMNISKEVSFTPRFIEVLNLISYRFRTPLKLLINSKN